MANKFIVKHRRGTTEQWIGSDIVLFDGEIAIEDRVDGTRGIIVGDGIHTYEQLSKMYLQEVWTLTLPADAWVKDPIAGVCEDRWCQDVTIPLETAYITAYSKVDLQPDDALIAMLIDEEITLTTKNSEVEGGGRKICVIAIGNQPSQDISIQATKTEVRPV